MEAREKSKSPSFLPRNYQADLEAYRENRNNLLLLLSSILNGISEPELLKNDEEFSAAFESLSKSYPFIHLAYRLDEEGHQIGSNLHMAGQKTRFSSKIQHGVDRSHRTYYKDAEKANSTIVTSPYLSTLNQSLIVSGAFKVEIKGKVLGYVVIDMDLSKSVQFLIGDTLRSSAEPYFKVVHTIFSFGLFGIVFVLLMSATMQMVELFNPENMGDYTKPLTAIIYMTLGMAIFDLAKTIFEEEVLTHKDIFRHAHTRRTITRFMASILIAVSIEALLLMFKGAMGSYELMGYAAMLMLTAVLLLIGLGVYVLLGAKAEVVLGEHKNEQPLSPSLDRRLPR